MKNLLIVYNVIFLLIGNVLITNIHYLDAHSHSHEYADNTCQECVIIENIDNYVLDFYEVNLLDNNTNLLIHEYFSILVFNSKQKFLSRAPPIS